MGTRTYSRRGVDGTRVPTALGIRTGKFRAVREGEEEYRDLTERLKPEVEFGINVAMEGFDRAEEADRVVNYYDIPVDDFLGGSGAPIAGSARRSIALPEVRREAYKGIVDTLTDVMFRLFDDVYHGGRAGEYDESDINAFGDYWDELSNIGFRLSNPPEGVDIWRVGAERPLFENTVLGRPSDALQITLEAIEKAADFVERFERSRVTRAQAIAMERAVGRAAQLWESLRNDERVAMNDVVGNELATMEGFPLGRINEDRFSDLPANIQRMMPRTRN